MNKKIIITVPIIIILVLLYVFSINRVDEKRLASTFEFSAVYFDDSHVVKISYLDRSKHTNTAILEIEGLSQPFQKKYDNSSFVEDMPISSTPQYGWKTTPVTLLIDHKEFGKIILKTEIIPYGQPSSKVIYGRP
ncbi:MAG TPA: hypothetical protein VFG24_02120 [Nitrosopumilaceae archaeon]|nr:hypothetical protein [Nitrosopumilaceae archaeon]